MCYIGFRLLLACRRSTDPLLTSTNFSWKKKFCQVCHTWMESCVSCHIKQLTLTKWKCCSNIVLSRHTLDIFLLYTYQDLHAKKHQDKNSLFALEKPADWSYDFFSLVKNDVLMLWLAIHVSFSLVNKTVSLARCSSWLTNSAFLRA